MVDEVLDGVTGGLVAEVDDEAEVVEVAPGADDKVGAADAECEPAGTGVGAGKFEVAWLERVAKLRGEVVRGGRVAIASIGVGVEGGQAQGQHCKEGQTT